jgi:hypothetical protein
MFSSCFKYRLPGANQTARKSYAYAKQLFSDRVRPLEFRVGRQYLPARTLLRRVAMDEVLGARIALAVAPTRGGTWQVRREGGERLMDLYSREAAELFALGWAKSHAPCVVHIYDLNGTVVRTHSESS